MESLDHFDSRMMMGTLLLPILIINTLIMDCKVGSNGFNKMGHWSSSLHSKPHHGVVR